MSEMTAQLSGVTHNYGSILRMRMVRDRLMSAITVCAAATVHGNEKTLCAKRNNYNRE